jgi:hypothetical protein
MTKKSILFPTFFQRVRFIIPWLPIGLFIRFFPLYHEYKQRKYGHVYEAKSDNGDISGDRVACKFRLIPQLLHIRQRGKYLFFTSFSVSNQTTIITPASIMIK